MPHSKHYLDEAKSSAVKTHHCTECVNFPPGARRLFCSVKGQVIDMFSPICHELGARLRLQ